MLKGDTMKLSIGDKAPQFCLDDKNETTICLKDVTTPYTLVYFYPKDNTPGCTTEALGFQALKNEYAKEGITVLGVSGGDAKSKEKFCTKHNLDISLVSDTDFSVSEKYGVYGEKKMMGRTFNGISRTSFLLDKDKTIVQVYPSVKPKDHPQQVIDDVRSMKGE